MKQRKGAWLFGSLTAMFLTGIIGYNYFASAGQEEPNQFVGKQAKAAEPLPIRQVVLFNSGVGYFQREGEIDGNARIELSFPVGDINDLLKSLILQDAKGRVGVVHYDSNDPIDKILRSFALDLTANPTFGQILNQARGEKIDITRAEKKGGAPTKISGTIVGMEGRSRPCTVIEPPPRELAASAFVKLDAAGDPEITVGDIEILNLHTTAGLQAIPMNQIISVRFQNPVLESEIQRALNVLARSHDTQKKTVSVGFFGEGKRAVRVGYVVERPIWKTTYRLRLDPKGKVFLQGWALVENTSDDDWNDVRMVLVSGKPISFKMNLYDPIYVPRPIVEPEIFASLRPPLYNSALMNPNVNADPVRGMMMGGMPGMMMGGGIMMGGMPGAMMGTQFQGGYGPNLNPFQQQSLQMLARAAEEKILREQNRLTYDELQRRRAEQLATRDEAQKKGSDVAGFNFKEGVKAMATGDETGDYYQYALDQKITLSRQKSAMLPIVDQAIEGQKVSIFNESVHPKHPLLGLRLKNSAGQPLTQGPIAVYDGGIFAGDTRILDVQANETRLLSYALDQGTEIKATVKEAPSPDMHFKLGADSLTARYFMRQTKTYTIRNRSPHDRQVILEHPIRANWKLVDAKTPIEKTRDVYRFQIAVPAGKTVSYQVAEDQPRVEELQWPPHRPGVFKGHLGQSPPDEPIAPADYAVAHGVNIKTTTAVDIKLTGTKIDKGFLKPTYKQRQSKAYFVQNLSDMDRTFTVDHVIRPGWARLDEQGDPQRGPAVFRFKLAVAQGKAAQQTVREETNFGGVPVFIKNLPADTIRGYLSEPVTSADVKAALTKALAMQAKIAEAHALLANVDRQLGVVQNDNGRVRENLRIIPMASDHYKTYLEKFVAQDRQIETLQNIERDLHSSVQTRMREYDLFLAKLDAE